MGALMAAVMALGMWQGQGTITGTRFITLEPEHSFIYETPFDKYTCTFDRAGGYCMDDVKFVMHSNDAVANKLVREYEHAIRVSGGAR